MTARIVRTRPIVAEQPLGEIWKQLRLFTDVGAVVDRIRTAQGVAERKHEANLAKQARQLAQSIKQGEEYFTAADSVSPATRPLLLYYGAISLARAVVLLRRDGTYSLDALRQKNRHAHHGLELVEDFQKIDVEKASPEEFFGSLACRCYFRDSDGSPWGGFPLFYGSLFSPAVLVRHTVIDQRQMTTTERDEVLGTVDKRDIETLRNVTLTILGLVRQMPDMWLHLIDLDLRPAICPGRIELETKPIHDGQGHANRAQQTWRFFVNAATSEQISRFKELQRINPKLTITSESSSSLGLHVKLDVGQGNSDQVYLPDVVDSITGRIFLIPEADSFLVEPAAQYAMLYALGMISRYYPDVWMSLIERNVLVSELTDSVLAIVARKFPQLILDQLTGLKHYCQLQ